MKPIVLPSLDLLDQLPPNLRQNEMLRVDLASIFLKYADYCQGLDIVDENKIFLIMNNNERILYDDGIKKNFKDKLNDPNLKDMLSQLYHTGEINDGVCHDHDPGRFRVKTFFDSIYGATPDQVKVNLIPVKFIGITVPFNSQNGAARALVAVDGKLAELIKATPELLHDIFASVSTFNWRLIYGTKRPSPHAWGIAIDLHARNGAYWRWKKSKADMDIQRIRREFPQEIVNLFEEKGFIWGGKWFHFDTFHFEYRPELLMKAKLIHKHLSIFSKK